MMDSKLSKIWWKSLKSLRKKSKAEKQSSSTDAKVKKAFWHSSNNLFVEEPSGKLDKSYKWWHCGQNMLWKASLFSFKTLWPLTIQKHSQRHNGPEDWVHLTKVSSWGHIMSSYTELAQISSSESWPRNNFKISTKRQHFD